MDLLFRQTYINYTPGEDFFRSILKKFVHALSAWGSEGEVEGDADAAAVDFVGDIEVVEAPDVVDAEDAEDVVEADGEFHVGFCHALRAYAFGEEEEGWICCAWGVAAVEAAVDAGEIDDFAEAELADAGDEAEECAVELVGGVPGDIRRVDELHGVHQGEAAGTDCVG